jgi:hypothetical protein
MHDTSEPSVTELVIDQLEELVVTIIDELRQRPSVAVAILAAVVGLIIGGALARRASRKRSVVARRAKSMAETSELIGLSLRLLQNPIVRGYLVSMLKRRLAP